MTLFATVYFLTGVPILKDGRDKHISMNAVLAVFPSTPPKGLGPFCFLFFQVLKGKKKTSPPAPFCLFPSLSPSSPIQPRESLELALSQTFSDGPGKTRTD